MQITSLVMSIDLRVSQCMFNSCKAATARVGFFGSTWPKGTWRAERKEIRELYKEELLELLLRSLGSNN